MEGWMFGAFGVHLSPGKVPAVLTSVDHQVPGILFQGKRCKRKAMTVPLHERGEAVISESVWVPWRTFQSVLFI